MLEHFTIAIGNKDECEIAVGTRDLNEAADRLLEAGLDMAVMKLGADGVMIATADGTRVSVPPYLVEVVCGLGSGDAFGGAFCHGLLEGWDPETIIKWGNAAGAIVAGRLMCADDMPTIADIETTSHRTRRRMSVEARTLHRPTGSLTAGTDAIELSPEDAGWTYSGLRVVRLDPGETRTFSTGG